MTDLARVPMAERELPRLYHELASVGARAEGRRVPWGGGAPSPEELVVLAAQAARQEPRLLWVLVELMAKGYDRFDPLKLRRALAGARWPAALGVAFEFARRVARSSELDDVAAFVMARTSPAAGERFFLGTRTFGGELARRDVDESLAEYRRWGYFSREEPLAKELGVTARGTLGPRERMNLLLRLVHRLGEVTLADYLTALRGRASRRQATRDLARAPFLTRTGATRGTRYRLATAEGRRKAGRVG
ncbi:MAG TPA: hypothetical protein VFR85_09610 [Anaeromyxobacteraceae bacterium]|nr:hypothetical protein [Anaeromyxobacteraceae bacterium]